MNKDEKNNYARELRLFVQRLIKMAKEQITVGRNYGWTQDSMAQELDLFIQEQLATQKKELVEEINNYWYQDDGSDPECTHGCSYFDCKADQCELRAKNELRLELINSLEKGTR